MYTHKGKIITCLLFVVLTLSCTPKRDRVWEMISLGFPEEISPKSAVINMGLYILKQTHEPLFRCDTNGEYYSKVLTKWHRDYDNKTFTFCPDVKKRFREDAPFTSEFLETFLRIILKSRKSDSIGKIEGCVVVRFTKSQPLLLKYLSSYERAPTLPTNNSKVHDGLGPFMVKVFENDLIHLVRKDISNEGYTDIKLYAYKGPRDKNLHNRSIEDFNRIYVSDIPMWVKNNYAEYEVDLLQSVNLVINHPKLQVRQKVWNCINIDRLRRAFMPGQSEFKDIKNVLPIGIIGAKPGLPNQTCDGETKLKGIKLVFANWKNDNYEPLKKFFADFEHITGIGVELQNLSLNEFIAVALKRPHNYHLTIAALDAISPSFEPFYSCFLREDQNLIDLNLEKVRNAFNLVSKNKPVEESSVFVDRLNYLLENEVVVLPIYQEVRKFYYPKHIKSLGVGRNFLEYPEVAELAL